MVNGSWLMAQSSTLIWVAWNTSIHTHLEVGCSTLRSTDQFGIHTYIHTYIHNFWRRCVQSFEEVQLINAVTRPTHLGNSMHKQDPMTKWSWACVWTWSSGQPIRPSTYIHTYILSYMHTYIHSYVLSSFKNNRHCHGPGHGLGHGKWLELIWGAIGPASGWLRPISSWLRPIWSCNDSLHTWYIHTELQQKQ